MKCHLHLGSNIGDRYVNLCRAIQMIEVEIGPIISSSSIYETEAWGVTEQDSFLNMAMEVEHYLTPSQLLKIVNQIEDKLGRVRNQKWGARLIDIDILFIEDIIIDTPSLTIPHKWMAKRNFVLFPLAEISGEKIHPIHDKTINSLLEECDDDSTIRKLDNEQLVNI